MTRPTLLVLLLLLLAGCASQNRELLEDLESGLRRMNYDDAVARWGPPTAITEDTDVVVATWAYSERGTLIEPPRDGLAALPRTSGYRLNLTFVKDERVMTGYAYQPLWEDHR